MGNFELGSKTEMTQKLTVTQILGNPKQKWINCNKKKLMPKHMMLQLGVLLLHMFILALWHTKDVGELVLKLCDKQSLVDKITVLMYACI